MFVFPYINIRFSFFSIDRWLCCVFTPAFGRQKSWLTVDFAQKKAFWYVKVLVRQIFLYFSSAFTFTRLQNICSIMLITSTACMSRMFHYHVFVESLFASFFLLLFLFSSLLLNSFFPLYSQHNFAFYKYKCTHHEEKNRLIRVEGCFSSFYVEKREKIFISSAMRWALPWTTFFCGN